VRGCTGNTTGTPASAAAAASKRQQAHERVDRGVAYLDNDAAGDALPRQVAVGVVAAGEQQVGAVVGDDTVDLLGHRRQARFSRYQS
jgi:hypothetical protein